MGDLVWGFGVCIFLDTKRLIVMYKLVLNYELKDFWCHMEASAGFWLFGGVEMCYDLLSCGERVTLGWDEGCIA